MRILVSGSTGLIGSAAVERLRAAGHSVSSLVRDRARQKAGDVVWNPDAPLDPSTLADVDAVIHLAGRTVSGRWNAEMKRVIRESRVRGTSTLANAVAESHRRTGKPATFISASAIGFYGNRGDELLTEQSSAGTGFLADVSREWEAATQPAADAGVRVVMPRISLVLSTRGGALAKMLLLFRLGLAGKIGNGNQWWSWITLPDLVAVLQFAVENTSLSGPVNAATPNQATNAEFTRTLAAVLHRPAIFPLPAFMARAMFAEAADELMLSSQRVAPERLLQAGFQFTNLELEQALRSLLSS